MRATHGGVGVAPLTYARKTGRVFARESSPMEYTFYADGDDNGLIRIADNGDIEQYQPTRDLWVCQPTAATNLRFSGDYEEVSEPQAHNIARNMRERFSGCAGSSERSSPENGRAGGS